MKTTQKRVWAILSAVMMLVSVLGGIVVLPVQAASVDYVTSGNYVYNWGQREDLATFLSPMAEDWYDDNNTSYAELSALSGSSGTSGAQGSALYNELSELMESNHSYETSYEATKDLFKYTDCQNSGGKISSFYSGTAIGPEWNSNEWNREHTWPNSKGDDAGNGENDIMMLRPTSVSENSSRGNKAYGNQTSSNYYNPNDEGEGAYDLRGDVARIVLYQHVRWGASRLFGSSGVIESKAVMLDWIEEDPVDTWELGRNDVVESITGTRNVFVDYPELAFLLFNEDVPDDYESPSGEGSTPAFAITATSSNTAYGTVSVSGKTITATPKSGYAVGGYTILSGNATATVTRNGNTFKVEATSDVSIRIDFTKKTSTTVQFVGFNGTTTQSAYVGDSISLPDYSGTLPDGYTFLGWTEQEVTETDTVPAYLDAGSSYSVSAGAVLYALYSRFESTGSGNSTTYEKYSGTITEGDYVIVYKDGAMKAGVSSDRLNYTEVSIADDSIEAPAADIVWHIAPNGDNWTVYNASAKAYAGGTGTKNKAALLTSVTDFAKWTVTGSSAYEFVNVGNKAKSVNANLRRNGTYGYACYSTGTGGALTLYKRAAGTMYYLTATACEHEYDNVCDTTCNLCGAARTVPHNYSSSITTPATCGKDGVRTYTCSVCGDSYTEAITATGDHDYESTVTTPATCGKDGVETYTCSVCGDSYTEAITATGDHDYESTVTTLATCGKDGVRTYTCSACGDSYTEAIPATGDHTYDNACDADCNACGNSRTPADHVYTADCDTVCDVCGAPRSVTAAAEATISFASTDDRVSLSTNTQVWENGGLTVTNNKTSGSSNIADYSNPVRFYKSSQIIIAYPGMTSLTITAPAGTYGTPWGATLEAAGYDYTGSDGVYTVIFSQPVDSVTLTASAQIRASSITVTAEGVGAEHVYDNACDATCNNCGTERETDGHDYAATVTTSATCGKDGVRTYTCSACGDSYTEAITATGDHTYDNACDADCNGCGATRIPADHVYGHDFDTDCDVCGAPRQIDTCVYSDTVLTSYMEMAGGTGGLAFQFEANVSGAVRNNDQSADLTNATVTINGAAYKVVALGAVVTNEKAVGTDPALMVRESAEGTDRVADVNATYLFSAEDNACTFAVRVIDIPANHFDSPIYARPYCIIECDGEQIVLYEDIVSATCNG